MAQAFDLVVVGSGTGGYVAAIRAAQLGLKTAVVERQKALGGTCLIWGCIPTKALLEHAHAYKIVQQSNEWGIVLDGGAPSIDVAKVHARKDKIVNGLTKGIEYLFKKNGITWIKGTARLLGNGKVAVTGEEEQELQAKEIVVATGSQPRGVPGIEIDRRRIITSDEAIHLKEIPKSMVILGSGAVGVEFGSIFNRFGTKVTILELLPRLVPVEDEAVSAELQKSFRKQGITAHTGARVTAARVNGDSVEIEAELVRRQDPVVHGRLPADGDRARPRHRRARGRGCWPCPGTRLRGRRRPVSDERAWHLRHRRCDHGQRGPAPATRARLVR